MSRLVNSLQRPGSGAIFTDALGLAAICVMVIAALALPGLG